MTSLQNYLSVPAYQSAKAARLQRIAAQRVPLHLPTLRQDQYQIVAHPAQEKLVAMGRRWGKTYMAGAYGVASAARGEAVAWVVPTYRNARPVWRFAEAAVMPAGDRVRVNRSDRIIEFPSGGWLGVYTADNDVAMRGEAFDLVIVDEAAQVREETYTGVLLPTLADRAGSILLISTPKGRNWFWREWVRAKADGRAWTAPSSANPSPLIQRAAEQARDRVSDRTYRQEWLAEFLEDGGGVFRNVAACATVVRPDAPEAHAGHVLVFGIDWAKESDYTVVTALCGTCKRVVDWDRFHQIDFYVQRARLAAMYSRWHPAVVWAESNSIGAPNIEMLRMGERQAGGAVVPPMPVRPFDTTAATKAPLIDGLALALERSELAVPAAYADELAAYEVARSKTGHATYSAPEGMHDDCVMSLAIAWHGARRGSTGGIHV